MITNQLATIPDAHTFVVRITAIGADLMAIAVDLANALDIRPELRAELIEAGLGHDFIDRLERLGRGQLCPKLLFETKPAYNHLAKLPTSVQKTTLENGIEILDWDETTTRIIPLDSLTPKQVKQAFAYDHIRDLAQQRTWIREAKRKLPRIVTHDVQIHKDYIVTPAGEKITRKQLLAWLTQMDN